MVQTSGDRSDDFEVAVDVGLQNGTARMVTAVLFPLLMVTLCLYLCMLMSVVEHFPYCLNVAAIIELRLYCRNLHLSYCPTRPPLLHLRCYTTYAVLILQYDAI